MDILVEKRNKLKEKVLALFSKPDYIQTPIKGLSAAMRTAPLLNQYCFYRPMAVFVLQGTKQSIIGTEKLTYHDNQMAVASVDMPAIGNIIEASPEKPFLSLVVDFDPAIIEQLLHEENASSEGSACRSMGVTDVDEALTDAFYRLVCLLDTPDKQRIMAPMILKEIYYLILTSPLGDILRSANTNGSHNNQIAHAVSWLKVNFRKPLKIDEFAQKFNMAESSFYRHFSKVTSLSPLQYQKKLRLYEAHRLMLSENMDVANAAYEVGYESPSQFNREYKRLFGIPPKTNIGRLKAC